MPSATAATTAATIMSIIGGGCRSKSSSAPERATTAQSAIHAAAVPTMRMMSRVRGASGLEVTATRAALHDATAATPAARAVKANVSTNGVCVCMLH